MAFIFYQDAAERLEVKPNTINQAVERGILTRAGRQGRNMQLLEEQVMLFTGINSRTGNKKRLSKDSLSPEELKQWQTYAEEAERAYNNPGLPDLEAYKERIIEDMRKAGQNILYDLLINAAQQINPNRAVSFQ